MNLSVVYQVECKMDVERPFENKKVWFNILVMFLWLSNNCIKIIFMLKEKEEATFTFVARYNIYLVYVFESPYCRYTIEGLT